MLPSRVTLGGRLCTTKELASDHKSSISEERKNVERNLTAKVNAASFAGIDLGYKKNKGSENSESENRATDWSRMTLETQGGNGLLASR